MGLKNSIKSAWSAIKRPVFGWEYRVARDLDLLNITNFPKAKGVGKINDVAAQGWQPCLVIESSACSHQVHILFKRRKLFPQKTTWKDSMTLKRDDDFDA